MTPIQRQRLAGSTSSRLTAADSRAGSARLAITDQVIRRQRLSDPHHVGTLAPTVTRLRREGQLPGMAR